MRRNRVVWFALAIVASVACCGVAAAASLTGTWSGTASVTTECPGVPASQSSGNAVLRVVQNGSAFSAVLTLDLDLIRAAGTCRSVPKTPLNFAMTGTISGDQFNAFFTYFDDRDATLMGSVSGDAMTILIATPFLQPATTVNAQVTRTSPNAPASALAGNYSGTYSYSADVSTLCHNRSTLSYTTPLIASVVQADNALAGSIKLASAQAIVRDASGNCTLQESSDTIALSGNISGTAFPAHLMEHGDLTNVTLTTSNTSISGMTSGGLSVSEAFSMMRSTGAEPSITFFEAHPNTICCALTSTLQWTTVNATSVTIDHGLGAQPLSGTISVTPASTTTYTLTATGPGGSSTATATVNVIDAPPALVLVSQPSHGMIAAPDGIAKDSVTLTNIGGTAARITLTQNGSFFTTSPAAMTPFILGAGESIVVTITTDEQPAGHYNGSIGAIGDGVLPPAGFIPVRLFVTERPTGPVDPHPESSRIVVQASGSANFTNDGSAAVDAIVASDATWLTPAQTFISIPAGQTRAIDFTIDPSQTAGSQAASLSLRFLLPASPTGRASAMDATPSIGTVSISIVSVVPPGTQPGAPPPLGVGEVAFMIPGIGATNNALADLVLSFRGEKAIASALRMFHAPAGVAAFLATNVSNIAANATIALPGIAKSVFNSAASSATLQLRSADINAASISVSRVNASTASGTYRGSLPLFRSDRGIAAGESLVLPGVLKASAVQTNVEIQEVSNAATQVRAEVLDASGNILRTIDTINVPAWSSVELADVASPTASAIRITNLGAGLINAYGVIVAASTGESWVVEDANVTSAPTEGMVFPFVSAGSNAETSLFLTNRTNGAISINVERSVTTIRRRAARSAGFASVAAQTIVLPAFASATVPLPGDHAGFVRVSGPRGTFVAAARSVVASGSKPFPFGTALPPVVVSSALAPGASKRFPGIDDASPSTRANNTPGTFRDSLLLVETGGLNTTVRLTLRYTFSAGGRISTQVTSTRDVTLSPAEVVEVSDLARSVIGAARDSYGDLRDMQLDVDVLGGGKVIPFLVTTDNGSNDTDVRRD